MRKEKNAHVTIIWCA